MNKSVSVVVPVYNVELYLERCVNSLLCQTIPFDEILLIDDGSTDSSGRLCDELAQRSELIKVIHQRNAGLGAARNRGIREARSEYIAFVDSDDWISPCFVEVMLDLLLSSGADIAMCGLARATTCEEYLLKAKKEDCRQTYSADEFMDIMLRYKGNRCVHYACAKLFSARILDAGHFPEGIYNEDVEAFFKCLLRAELVAETSRVMYCYYNNGSSITGSVFGENYLCLEMVWERVRRITEKQAPELLSKVEYNEKRAPFTVLCDMLVHGTASTDALYEKERRTIQDKLRHNLPILLAGPMPFGRKSFAVILAYGFPLVRFAVRRMKTVRLLVH